VGRPRAGEGKRADFGGRGEEFRREGKNAKEIGE